MSLYFFPCLRPPLSSRASAYILFLYFPIENVHPILQNSPPLTSKLSTSSFKILRPFLQNSPPLSAKLLPLSAKLSTNYKFLPLASNLSPLPTKLSTPPFKSLLPSLQNSPPSLQNSPPLTTKLSTPPFKIFHTFLSPCFLIFFLN